MPHPDVGDLKSFGSRKAGVQRQYDAVFRVNPYSLSGAEPQVFPVFILQFEERVGIAFENRQAVIANIFFLLLPQALSAQRAKLSLLSGDPHNDFILSVKYFSKSPASLKNSGL